MQLYDSLFLDDGTCVCIEHPNSFQQLVKSTVYLVN